MNSLNSFDEQSLLLLSSTACVTVGSHCRSQQHAINVRWEHQLCVWENCVKRISAHYHLLECMNDSCIWNWNVITLQDYLDTVSLCNLYFIHTCICEQNDHTIKYQTITSKTYPLICIPTYDNRTLLRKCWCSMLMCIKS